MYILTLPTIEDFAEVCNENNVDIRLDIDYDNENESYITAFDLDKKVIYECNLAILIKLISRDLIKDTGLNEWEKRKKLTYKKLKETLYMKYSLYFKSGKWRVEVPNLFYKED